MNAYIRVDGLYKDYGSIRAVDGISFEVGAGEIVSLLGPNGSGKTSCLECLEGLRRVDGGTFSLMGDQSKTPGSWPIATFGVQLQNSALPQALRVQELFRLICAYRHIAFRWEMIDRFGLAEHRRKTYGQLSVGLQRRVALSLAFAHDPKVVILDEPSAGLDVESRHALHECLLELRSQGTAILMASHDMAEVEALSDRVLVLIKGRIIQTGSPAALTALGEGYTKIMVHSQLNSAQLHSHEIAGAIACRISGEYTIFFSAQPAESVAALLDLLKRSGDSLIDLRVERPTLEERYLEIVDGGTP